ncbi:MAG: acetylneuraminic acid synthetase, partial [Deltaproteobacteria bacterium]|nr:acetylneuraminic acid synthetase [Deltaproteobacteria bacterium]
STNEEKRELSVSNLQKIIDVTHRLKAHFRDGRVYIITHVGGFSMDEPVIEKHELLANLDKSLGELREGETEIIIENM